MGHQLKGDAVKQVGHQLKGECFGARQLIVYFLGGGAGGVPLLWSPKTIALLWFSWVCEGYPCPDCVFCNFLARFNKEFAVSGLGMVFKFQRFQLALGSVVEQPIV